MEARNPVRSNGGKINLEYKDPQHGWIPFTASPTDQEKKGRDLFAKAEAGDYGEVLPEPEPTYEELALIARSRREDLLQELDVQVSNPLRFSEYTDEQVQALKDYRQDLLDISNQEGFPYSVEFPTKPV